MTTPNEELRKQLQQIYKSGELDYRVISDAADLLQSQAERIAELEQASDEWKAAALVADQNAANEDKRRREMQDERDTLRAQIAAIDATAPFAYGFQYKGETPVDVTHRTKESAERDWPTDTFFDVGEVVPVFTRPMPAQDVTELVKDAERYRFIRDVPYSDYIHNVMSHQKNSVMDAAIDAARASLKGAK